MIKGWGAGSVGEPPVNFGNYLRSKIGVSYRKTVRTPLGIFRSARRFGLNGTLDRAAAPILQTMADVKGLGPIGFEELLQLSSISSISKKAEQKQCWGSQLTGKCCDTAGFTAGVGHFKQKFCPSCLRDGVYLDASHVRAITAGAGALRPQRAPPTPVLAASHGRATRIETREQVERPVGRVGLIWLCPERGVRLHHERHHG